MDINNPYVRGVCNQWNTPNTISLYRVVLGLTIPWWWGSGEAAILAVVISAGISDGVDGAFARWFKLETALGRVIDPLADKLFTIPFLLLAAAYSGHLGLWLLAVVNLGYDLDNTYQRRKEILAAFRGKIERSALPVTWTSKSKTAFLFLFMGAFALSAWVSEAVVFMLAGASTALIICSWWHNRKQWFYDITGW